MDIKVNSTDISKHFYFDSSDEVLREVLEIIRLISSGFNTKSVCEVFDATECLYKGNFPGYSACNTGYHDFRHAIDTFLAMARLIHGAVLAKNFFSERQIITALTAAILHDAGYIQEKSDNQGTGAKYKINHEQRSMAFLSRHGFEFGLSAEEIAACNSIILCTDMNADISAISFSSLRIELLGKMLGTADLMAQLAERRYLEKLLYLYHEYKEAGIGDYENEVDILHKAADFYEFYYDRLRTTLDGVDRFMQLHFASRWGIYQDLYDEMIDRQKNYLFKILKVPHTDPREYLRRDGIVKKLREQYAKDAPANRQTSSKTPGNI
jgi:HD superfamily phosphodiesterase